MLLVRVPMCLLGNMMGADWPNLSVICEGRGHEKQMAFCHHIQKGSCRGLGGCPSQPLCFTCACWEASSQHRVLEQVGPQRCAGDPSPQLIPTPLHRYACPCFPQVHWGVRWGGSQYQSGRPLPSCSHSSLLRVPCCQLDSGRKTRPRKQPPARLTVSICSCTWRRKLWNRRTGKTLCPSLEKRRVRTSVSWD